MRLSLQVAVTLIVLLLFAASIISLFLAIQNRESIPLLLVAIANLLAVLLLTFLITRGILLPLRRIREATQDVIKGDLYQRISPSSIEEVGELGDALNRMLDAVQKERDRIQEAKTTLEIQVQARTRELRELASSLETKIQDRTKELQEKVRELERFQKLAIGRELKMVELKREIERLKNEKGRES